MAIESKTYAWGIFRLWINWMIGSGALVLLVMLSTYIRPVYLPFVAFILQFIIVQLMHHNRRREFPSCYVYPFVVSRILFWSAISMIVINLLYFTGLFETIFPDSPINHDVPYIMTLIISPWAIILTWWTNRNGHNSAFCRDCLMRHGSLADRGRLGSIYTKAGYYQLRMLFWLSVVIEASSLIYYFLLYTNVSLSKPDRFIFILVPTLLWIASSAYLGLRYLGIFEYYRQNYLHTHRGDDMRNASTLIRYLVVNGNRIAMRPPQTDADLKMSLDEKFDTPATVFITRQSEISVESASFHFSNLTGVSDHKMRFMYSTIHSKAERNTFHFLATLTDSEAEEFDKKHPDTIWLDIRQVSELINDHTIAPMLAAEVIRYHTIASTFKSYHSNGRRRYKVAGYHPATDFADIASLPVDYSDPHWIFISQYNQDTPNRRLRLFWRRFINGLGTP
ncbi:MAG: hypothetical protein NC111_05665 [Bacteroides sp.]|nr:hypothetical protein [Bacteroides sp.]MCM1413317.1 hypothetical protein [Bacteroides sp.]MCM1471997.1 hypothetical protein [Bacteroides sp.]